MIRVGRQVGGVSFEGDVADLANDDRPVAAQPEQLGVEFAEVVAGS